MQRNIGGLIRASNALVIPTFTAGAAGDNTEVTGETIDRNNAMSATFVVNAKAVLAANETLTVKATLQHYINDAWADMDADQQPGGAANSTIFTLTGPGGGGTVQGSAEIDVDLSRNGDDIRIQVLPDLSRANTDTATVAAVCVLGGLVMAP